MAEGGDTSPKRHFEESIRILKSNLTEDLYRDDGRYYDFGNVDISLEGLSENVTLQDLEQLHDISEEMAERNSEIQRTITNIVKREIGSRIHRNGYPYQGEFIEVGSYRDGTRPGELLEMDYIFVNQSIELDFIPLPTKPNEEVEYQIRDRETEKLIEASEIQTMFSNAIERIMETIKLTDEIYHAGYACPKFSGVRRNGPATTLLFKHRRQDEEDKLISVDMTPAFSSYEIEKRLEREMKSQLYPFSRDNKRTFFGIYSKIHLVPKPPDDKTWQLTTSVLEADFMHAIPENSPVKKIVQIGKFMNGRLKQSIEQNPGMYKDSTHRRFSRFYPQKEEEIFHQVVQAIKLYDEKKHTRDEPQLRKEINKMMKYFHAYVPHDQGDALDELTKSPLSLNSTAIKYLAFAKGRDHKGFFGSDGSDEMKEDKLNTIIHHIVTAVKSKVPHYFLRGYVDLWTVGCYVDPWVIQRLKQQAKRTYEKIALNLKIGRPLHWPTISINVDLFKKHRERLNKLNVASTDHNQSEEEEFLCTGCCRPIFRTSDIYVVGGRHRTVLNDTITSEQNSILVPVPSNDHCKRFDGMTKTHDVMCRRCGYTDWGIVVSIEGISRETSQIIKQSILLIKPVGFRVRMGDYVFPKRYKRWKMVPFMGNIGDFSELL